LVLKIIVVLIWQSIARSGRQIAGTADAAIRCCAVAFMGEKKWLMA
jgi:hypothetical protein